MIIVKDLIGIPYKDHGRDNSGMDCYGITIEVLRRFGKTMPDVFYADTNNKTNEEVLRVLEKGIPNINIKFPEEGAVVEIIVMGQPSHVGVCLGDGTFIHALKKIGVVIEPLFKYEKKIRGFYRVNN